MGPKAPPSGKASRGGPDGGRTSLSVVDRESIGGWIEGPGGSNPLTGYRGDKFGAPPSGPGSLAGLGRRLAALTIDWLVAILVVQTLAPGTAYGSTTYSLLVLVVFGVQVALLTALGGASLGQRLVGLRVIRVDGAAVSLLPVVVRTALICLAIPPLLMDRDGRGWHDRAARSMVVRSR